MRIARRRGAGQNERDFRATARPNFEKASDDELLASRSFHSFLVYGILMKTLARFRVGRRIGWSFGASDPGGSSEFRRCQRVLLDKTSGLHFGSVGKGPKYVCLSDEIVRLGPNRRRAFTVVR